MSGFRPHLGISASAGSGKTFQLAHRVMRLLAMDQDPDRIGAYTFSRKAAGGIFDEIIGYLRRAAGSPADAETTSTHLGMTRAPADFEADLRRLFDHMHRLRIGTLDSRISRMVSAASVELGLPADFALMDSGSAEYLRLQSRVLNRLFQGNRLSEEDADTFVQLFEEATYGRAEKDFHRLMEQFLSEYRLAFLEHSDAAAWRDPHLEDPPRVLEPSERDERARSLLDALEDAVPHKGARKSFASLIEACRVYGPGSSWSRDTPTSTLWKGFLREPSPEVAYGRSSFTLPPTFWEDLAPLLRHPMAVALDETRRRTRAVYGFLLAYEHTYRRTVPTEGTLAFEDACTLMAGFHLLTPAELAYRLDGEIDHWLLDEFQDTSQLQWNVLRPFVEEVLQDPEARRTFFYVGDVKQAIYGWRGGDSTLFNRIRDQWPRIEIESMDVSWRSAPPVLDLVNHLLDDLPGHADLPSRALDRWNDTFTPHRAARPDMAGHARIVQLREDGPGMEDAVLRQVRQLPRGCETAILVHINAEGEAYARRLREAGVPVSLEGAAELRDDTGVEVLLAALKLAAHPGDMHSRRMVEIAGLPVRPFDLLIRVNRHGVAHALRELMGRLPLLEDAAFTRSRLRRLLDLALEYDALGDPGIDRFLAYVDKAHLKEHEARGVVRVMTIHQSKGLGFDAVIVPVAPRGSLIKVNPGQPVSGEDPDPFLTLLPPKDVCLALPAYRDLYTRLEEDSLYENLCTLYVALTRAKRSLQVVLPAEADPGKSRRVVPHWIAARLEGAGREEADGVILYESGSPEWKEAGLKTAEEEVPPPPAFPLEPGEGVLPRLEPSRAEEGPERAERLFREIQGDGRELGTRVHDLLRRVEWSDGLDPDAFLRGREEDPDGDAAAHVRAALASGELRKPEGATDLWRERKFESVLPEGWITGIFDRVVLLEDGALIQDFKTNRSTGAETVDHYRPQMALYRKVLADMLSLDPGRVRCQLIFTRTGAAVEV